MLLDHLGLVRVLVGQNHIALVVFHLVGSSLHFIRIDHAVLVVAGSVANDDDVNARIPLFGRFPVDVDIFQGQLGGNIALLEILKQQLVLGAGGGKHIIGLHRKIRQRIAHLEIRIFHCSLPQLIQFLVLNHAHGHAVALAVQRPAFAPEGPALLCGNEEYLHFKDQLDFRIDTNLQV